MVTPVAAPPEPESAHDAIQWPSGVDPAVVVKAALFRDLKPEQISSFVMSGTPRTFEAGESIIIEGNTDTDTFVILKGRIDVVKKLPPVLPGGAEGQKTIVSLTAPMMGIFAMGAPNMLAGIGRGTSVVAAEACDAIVVSKEAYERLALQDPLLGYFITRNIALEVINQLNATNQRVVKLTQALTLALQKRT
jgi:CRP/FNR family transcriptional regulator, cyclic AMP receptor protein